MVCAVDVTTLVMVVHVCEKRCFTRTAALAASSLLPLSGAQTQAAAAANASSTTVSVLVVGAGSL